MDVWFSDYLWITEQRVRGSCICSGALLFLTGSAEVIGTEAFG